MSSVFLHVGQCGNQLSLPLWDNFLKYQSDNHPGVFTALDNFHRCIHVDSEPKVIASLPKYFKIRSQNVIVGKKGRGSNFALGYNGLTSSGDDKVFENINVSVRKEIERCDYYSGAIVIHSLSGGTGSGLGCRIIEMLRDEYPCNHIMSCAVLPYESGESPLQSYNILLSVHWLQNFTDTILFLQNDMLSSCLMHPNNPGNAKKHVSFKNMNQLAGNMLSGVFLPTDTLSSTRGISINQEPWELVRTLTPMPSTKFINLTQYTSSKLSWDDLVNKTLQHYPKYLGDGTRTKCLGATVIARGDSAETFLPCLKRGVDTKIKKSLNTVQWNPYPLDCWTSVVNSFQSKKDSSSSLTLASNSSKILDPLDNVLARAGMKMKYGAYMHWYQRHGITDDIFKEGTETLETVKENYKEAVAD